MFLYNRWPIIFALASICGANLLGMHLQTQNGRPTVALVALSLSCAAGILAWHDLQEHIRLRYERSLLRRLSRTLQVLLRDDTRLVLSETHLGLVVAYRYELSPLWGRASTFYRVIFSESDERGGVEYGTRRIYQFDTPASVVYRVEPLNPDFDLEERLTLKVILRRLFALQIARRATVSYDELREIDQILKDNVVRRNLPR